MASCRETPGCPISTISTSWLTDRSARRFELRDQRLDLVWTPTRDVPHIGVTRGQLERRVALGSDPDRGVWLLDRLGVGDRVGHLVIATVEVRPVLGEQRLHDLQRLAEPADAVVESFDPVHLVFDLRPRCADAEFEPAP